MIFYEDGSMCLVVNKNFQIQVDTTGIALPLALSFGDYGDEGKSFGIQILFFGFVFLWGGEE